MLYSSFYENIVIYYNNEIYKSNYVKERVKLCGVVM